MKALVGAFNQEMALVGAFSVIVIVEPMEHYTALVLGQAGPDIKHGDYLSITPAHRNTCRHAKLQFLPTFESPPPPLHE